MRNIALPKKIHFKDGKKPNEGTVTIEPCYSGYGMTLGNSLRRVLLSSLPGAAVVGVKIAGVEHEFTTLPHIKEDILEIILNLKQLRLKIFSDEEIKLELDVAGEKKVKARDITKNSDVEIINSDLVLADITDMAGSLNMEIYVNFGRGYCPVESIEEKKNIIGYIEMDAIYSPVLSAGIKIDNVRVGKMTNWDKLILNIVTDGTMSYKEAFEQSAQILIEQFSALISKKHPSATLRAGENTKTRKHENKEEEKGLSIDSGQEKEKSEKEQNVKIKDQDNNKKIKDDEKTGKETGEKKKRGRPRKS